MTTLASCLPSACVRPRPEGSIACFAYKITTLGLRHGRMRSGPTSADAAIGRPGYSPGPRGRLLQPGIRGCSSTALSRLGRVFGQEAIEQGLSARVPAAVLRSVDKLQLVQVMKYL